MTKKLNENSYLEALIRKVDERDLNYIRQLRHYKKTNPLKEIVALQVKQLDEELKNKKRLVGCPVQNDRSEEATGSGLAFMDDNGDIGYIFLTNVWLSENPLNSTNPKECFRILNSLFHFIMT